MTPFSRLVLRLDRAAWRNPAVFGLIWIPALTVFILSFNPALTADLAPVRRAVFWALHVALLLPLLMVGQELLSGALARFRLPPLALVGLTALVVSVVFAPLSMALDVVFSTAPDLAGEPGWTRLALDGVSSLVVPVFCVWFLVNGTRLALVSQPIMDEPEASADPPPLTEVERAFWAQVPRSLGHDLIALSAEQHYLHVYTARGHSLILFPIGKATGAVARLEGLRVHRSHWVALGHVASIERESQNLLCRMSNGLRVPVSRANRAVVQEALKEADERRLPSVIGAPSDRTESRGEAPTGRV